MKQRTIWTLTTVMGVSFLILLFLQLKYIQEMVEMKREQFDESVNRALYQVSHDLEFNETQRYLEKNIRDTQRHAALGDTAAAALATPAARQPHQAYRDTTYTTFQLRTLQANPAAKPKAMILHTDRGIVSEARRSLQEIVKNRYIYQKALLDEVVVSILYSASDKPLEERINFRLLDQDLKAELMNGGVNIPYHFTVSTHDGREVYRCPDYEEAGEEYSYSQTLFHNDPAAKMGIVRVHFPDMSHYIYTSVRFMIPSVIFTVILMLTFVFTIFTIFRSKRLTEVKTDFINNMTHELKTPIASISLASQMLSDSSVKKSEAMMAHLSGVIQDETKRLRFLVEKVLQMSMFDKKKAVFKRKRLDLNEMVESVENSFTLRVEHTGGHIYTEIGAVDSTIYVDEMHFQNAIFNLMDNAVKYGKPGEPLDIYLRTWNDDHHLYLSVRDTGVGIRKENQKKVFEKFYRVHTGNVHDVKGFGLGLPYVKNIVALHGGEIRVESEWGHGTTFTIKLPVIHDA